MKIKARGQLSHHFHGNYWSTIGLLFDSPEHARMAREHLVGWNTTSNPRMLSWSGDSAGTAVQVALLESLGAKPGTVDSLAHSVDCGEPFTVAIDVTDPNQATLF